MSKERARKRAKARKANKTAKRKAAVENLAQKTHPGAHNPGGGSIKGPGGQQNVVNTGGAHRSAARSS